MRKETRKAYKFLEKGGVEQKAQKEVKKVMIGKTRGGKKKPRR